MKEQIEEMAKLLLSNDVRRLGNIDNQSTATKVANVLYNAGYRKQEWISVDERLPMYGELVLVSSMDLLTKKHGWFYLASYDKERKWWNGALFGHVTHWMPLPEAPKMKGGAE